MSQNDDELAWTPLESVRVHENRVFAVERRRMRRVRAEPGDAGADFFVVASASWVNIVALTPADELVLIEQWRHGVLRSTLEIPGGMIDPGEDPAVAARRELLEETGFQADTWLELGHIEPNPAIIDNRCHTYLALDARKVAEPQFDHHEHCRLVVEPYANVEALVSAGKITHALVVVALYYERLRRAGVLEARAAPPPGAPVR